MDTEGEATRTQKSAVADADIAMHLLKRAAKGKNWSKAAAEATNVAQLMLRAARAFAWLDGFESKES